MFEIVTITSCFLVCKSAEHESKYDGIIHHSLLSGLSDWNLGQCFGIVLFTLKNSIYVKTKASVQS